MPSLRDDERVAKGSDGIARCAASQLWKAMLHTLTSSLTSPLKCEQVLNPASAAQTLVETWIAARNFRAEHILPTHMMKKTLALAALVITVAAACSKKTASGPTATNTARYRKHVPSDSTNHTTDSTTAAPTH